jgi:hypothetical protein
MAACLGIRARGQMHTVSFVITTLCCVQSLKGHALIYKKVSAGPCGMWKTAFFLHMSTGYIPPIHLLYMDVKHPYSSCSLE